jgi:Putative 2OG-Fe(II) oxygenase
MLYNLTFSGNPPLIPKLEIPCFKASMTAGIAKRLEQIVQTEKDHILANTPVPPKTNPGWLTGRFWYYNLLDYDYEELEYLKSFIKEQYVAYMTAINCPAGPCYIRVWANVLKFKQEITWHNHFDCVTGVNIDGPVFSHASGNICIKTFDTKTWFRSPFLGGVGQGSFGKGHKFPNDVIGVDNIVGECLFFPSWVVHRTDENETTEPRITISFDIIPESIYLAKENNEIFRRLI